MNKRIHTSEAADKVKGPYEGGFRFLLLVGLCRAIDVHFFILGGLWGPISRQALLQYKAD